MAIGLINFPNITPPDFDYPSGRIKDDTGAEDGTPIDLLTNGDLQELPAKLMRLQAITPNGLPDNEYSGHQYLEALWKFGNANFATDLIRGLIGTYTANDLIILWGCSVTANIPGTSSITQGAIYYNDVIYKVPAIASIPSPSNTLVFQISGLDLKTITLVNGASLSGIADYLSSTIKKLYGNSGTITVSNNWTLNGAKVVKSVLGECWLEGQMTLVGSPVASTVIGVLPVGFRPVFVFTNNAWPVYCTIQGVVQTGYVSINNSNGEINLISASAGFSTTFLNGDLVVLTPVRFNVNI